MDVQITFSQRDRDTLRDVTERVVVDPKDNMKTVGEIRKEFALKHALFEERFRFVNIDDGKILHDSDLLKSIVRSPAESRPTESDEDCSDEAEEDNCEESNSEPVCGESDTQATEKGSYDSSEEDKNSMEIMTDRILEVLDRCISNANKGEESYDHSKVRADVKALMQKSRDQVGKGSSSADDGAVRRRPRLRIRVEEGFPIFLNSENDGVKFLACLNEDTLQVTKERFAKLFDCPVNEFRIHKEDETRVIEDGDDTLGAIGMGEGRSFKAWREGSKEIITIFGFSVCAKILVDFTKSIHSLNETVQTIAPDLSALKLKFWYNGVCLPNELGMSPDDATPLGRLILGSHFLRVMIEFDPTLDIAVDKGPDMVVKRPPRDKPIVTKMRRRPDGSGYSPVRDEETVQNNERISINQESKGKELPNESKGTRIIRLNVNKRALRPFSISVQYQFVENLFSPAQNGAEHESSITINNLTPSMRLHELREEIAKKSAEKWQHQILFCDGSMLKPSDDYKTLRELGLKDLKVIYREPCINVHIKVSKDTFLLRVAGSSTTFERLANLLENEKVVELNRDEIRFMYQGVLAFPKCAFSEYGIKDGDNLDLVRPLRIRLWHKCYAYDKDVYPFDNPADLLDWISKETGITKAELLITWAMGDPINSRHHTLKDCGFDENHWEIQVFEKSSPPQRLKVSGESSGDFLSKYPDFVESEDACSDDACSEDDEDDV